MITPGSLFAHKDEPDVLIRIGDCKGDYYAFEPITGDCGDQRLVSALALEQHFRPIYSEAPALTEAPSTSGIAPDSQTDYSASAPDSPKGGTYDL